MKSVFKTLATAATLTIAVDASAVVIDFESGLDPQFSYSGVSQLSHSLPADSGYETVKSYTNSNGLAYNPSEATPSTFSWNGGGTFDLNSFVIAGAWGSQTLTIEGLLNNVVQHTTSLFVTHTAVSLFTPGWANIDGFRISTGNDFVPTPNLGGNGQHWALDNLTINENIAVSEPGSIALLGLGLVGLAWTRRQTAK